MSATEIRSLNGYKLNDETARGNIEKLRTESQQYTNTKISQLINSAPTTLDTLGEIAAAMAENATVVEALDAAIGQKADKNDIPSLDGLATEEYVAEAIASVPKGEPDWSAKEGEEGYIKNRTHWDNGFDFRFDGDLSKYNEVVVYEASNELMKQTVTFIKVSDIPLTKEEILGSICIKQLTDHQIVETYNTEEDFTINEDNILMFSVGASVFIDNFNFNETGCILNKGFYLVQSCMDVVATPEVDVLIYPARLYKEEIHQLDPKFIPTATDDEIIDLLISIDAFPALTDESGNIYTDEADNILLI